MKILHTADWHIGRKLNGFSLLEEQKDMFQKVLALAIKEEVDAIVIAGDLYDRSVPSVEAVSLFNEMMIEMNITSKFPVLAISGNHDSATRLDTGSPWLKTQNFHLHTKLSQAMEAVELNNIQFYLLPYFEPFHARQYFNDDSLRDIHSSMKTVIEKMKESFDPKKKQVLISHFFAAGASKSDSETPLEVGGLDSVPVDMLNEFDYVALGHLHYKDAIKNTPHVKYSGSLLKYSLSEEHQEKGIRLVDINESEVVSEFIPLTPLRDVHQLTGSFKELTSLEYYSQVNREDYLAISLTDQTVIVNAINELRQIYPRLISLERVNQVTQEKNIEKKEETLIQLKPEVLLKRYFEEVTEKELSAKQQIWLEEAIIENSLER
ncbi:MAG: exonuclease SbcCD subunit D [Vagococcus sp.]|uniref:exonuclease SbcCD subunit D n=1 Tax=Vagococcus sp. TaxID=1933889 RepID=UPI002FC686C0